jgi:type VI secretion system Hcp family effector
VRFTKEWNASSPQLFKALVDNEALREVTFEFVRSNDDGEEVIFHRVSLTDARIVGLRSFIDLDAEPSSLMPLPPLEDVTIAYASITLENLVHNTSGTSGKPGQKLAKETATRQSGTKATASKPAAARRR